MFMLWTMPSTGGEGSSAVGLGYWFGECGSGGGFLGGNLCS